jgi:hypothetical protein
MKHDIAPPELVEYYHSKEAFVERMKVFDPKHTVGDDVLVVGQCPSGWGKNTYRENEKALQYTIERVPKYRPRDTYQRMSAWMHAAQQYTWDWQNVIPHIIHAPTDIKYVMKNLLTARIKPYKDKKIITLGNFAANVLTDLGFTNFLPVPHPSGLNRKLNDFEEHLNTIRSIRDYLRA